MTPEFISFYLVQKVQLPYFQQPTGIRALNSINLKPNWWIFSLNCWNLLLYLITLPFILMLKLRPLNSFIAPLLHHLLSFPAPTETLVHFRPKFLTQLTPQTPLSLCCPKYIPCAASNKHVPKHKSVHYTVFPKPSTKTKYIYISWHGLCVPT